MSGVTFASMPVHATVPWSPGMERFQMTKLVWVELRTMAACVQLGARKGLSRDELIAANLTRSVAAATAYVLGMFDANCDAMADEYFFPRAKEQAHADV